MNAGKFEIRDRFYLDGNPYQIISGGIHYFRVVPEYWRDRLEKLKALGCNTVETYVPWNLHEPHPGEFDFSGMLDLERFLSLAGELGLHAIVRPSPYICGEWEFGGLPAWLLAEEGMRLRVSDPRFLKCVERYYQELFPRLAPLQVDFGGPVILMQVENEYGYYGNDKSYLRALERMMRENGATVPFVTSDGPWGEALSCGQLEGVLPTGNFGSKTDEQFRSLAQFTDGGPLMCMEFWVGWFDHWGCGKHNTTEIEPCARDFEALLQTGNVNIYMFHGGTNFGFMNGANYYEELTPDVTSYDYDALLTESGEITPKYRAFQEIIRKYAPVPQVEFTTPIRRQSYGRICVEKRAGLFSVLQAISTPVESPYTLPMEKLGQNYGYTLYRTRLGKGRKSVCQFRKANDRAILFINGKWVKTLYDRELLEPFELEFPGEAVLDILLENMGRVNFAQNLEHQRKGIDEGFLMDGHHQHGWTIYPLPLDHPEQIPFSGEEDAGVEDGPAFHRFRFTVEELGDTFLDTSGWGKGVAFINGFHLGRYWDKGPQQRLYLPAPLLHLGQNELLLFETEGVAGDSVSLEAEAKLGPSGQSPE